MKTFGLLNPVFGPDPDFDFAIACVAANSLSIAKQILATAGFRGRTPIRKLNHRPEFEATAAPGVVCWACASEQGFEVWNKGDRTAIVEFIARERSDRNQVDRDA